jgi:SAM-dependent methyltransferase
MEAMKSIDAIMRWPVIYQLWMAPQAKKKFAPILAHNDLRQVRRVLDVGCGPGTNAHHFSHANYLGIDWNERYIRDAQARHKGRFVAADATKFAVPPDERFDLILVNSLLHHIDASATEGLLSHLNTLLTEDGHVHIVELVLPEKVSVARFLARADRGEYPRPLEEWRQIFIDAFEEVVFEPFVLAACGLTL